MIRKAASLFVASSLVGAAAVAALPQGDTYVYSAKSRDAQAVRTLVKEQEQLAASMTEAQRYGFGFKRRDYCVSCQSSKKKCSVKTLTRASGQFACGVANPGCNISDYNPDTCK